MANESIYLESQHNGQPVVNHGQHLTSVHDKQVTHCDNNLNVAPLNQQIECDSLMMQRNFTNAK